MGRFKWLEFDERAPRAAVSAPEEEEVDEAVCLERADQCFRDESYERALYSYSRALRYQINLERAWVGQVRCLLAMDENAEADLWADRGLSRFPSSADLLAAKALALSRTRGTTAGMRFSDRALETSGGTEYVWLTRGEILLAAKSEEPAMRCLAKAVEMAGHDWHCHYLIGRLLQATGDPARALRYFTDAARCDSRQARPWVKAAECHQAMGQIDAAQAALYRALQLNPNERSLRRSLRELQRIGPLRRLWRSLRGR